MCTVMIIQYHCGQTFSTHLDGGEGRSPVRRGCKAQPRDNKLVFTDRIFVNTKLRISFQIFTNFSAQFENFSAI